MNPKTSFLNKYYLFCLFSSADFTRGIHLVYLLNLGFSNSYTGIAQTVLFFTTFIFEIPLGYLSDKYKHKYTIFLGVLCFIFSCVIYLTSQNQFVLPLLYFLQGLGYAFYSGATFSLLYNRFSNEAEDQVTKYLAASRRISMLSLAVATIVGGFLANINWNYVFVLFLIFNIFAAITISLIDEPRDENKEEEADTKNEKIKLKTVLIEQKRIFILVFGLAFLEAFHTPFFIFFQNYLELEGLSIGWISTVIASAIVISSFVLILEKRVRDINIFKKMNLTILSLLPILLVLYFTNNIYVSVALFILINSLPSLLFVFTDDYLNQEIPDHVRATFMSIVSLINSVLISIIYLTFGSLFDQLDHLLTISLLGILLIPSLILINYFKKQNKKNAIQAKR